MGLLQKSDNTTFKFNPPQDSFDLCKYIKVFQLQLKSKKTREKKEDAYLLLVQCQVHLGSKGAKILMGPAAIIRLPFGPSQFQESC